MDPWGIERDARLYRGPHKVVGHPECRAWGNYAKPTITSRALGPLLGDDGGQFESALNSVRTWGGVLEHPKGSRAFERYGLPRPAGEWSPAPGGWVCEVDQGHYGHVARKPTWLYASGARPADLIWGPSEVAPIGSGARRGNLESLSKRKRAATPREFAELLIEIARSSRIG